MNLVIEYSSKYELANLDLVKKYEPLLHHYKVSKTSMGKKHQMGFLEVFYKINGSEKELCELEYKDGMSWMMKREKFLDVFLSKWTSKKIPMKIGLSLIAWAYMPDKTRFNYKELDDELQYLIKMNRLVSR